MKNPKIYSPKVATQVENFKKAINWQDNLLKSSPKNKSILFTQASSKLNTRVSYSKNESRESNSELPKFSNEINPSQQ